MPFNISTGVYTAASGATSAATGQIIQSAVWNSIHTDFQTALTELGTIALPGVSGAAWVNFTPAISSGSGAITTATVGLRYNVIGKQCSFVASGSVSNNGSGATNLQITLPFASNRVLTFDTYNAVFVGNLSTGSVITGNVLGTTVFIVSATGAYPISTGQSFLISGTYETT